MKKAVQALLRRIFGPLFFGLAAATLTTACALRLDAELLNPLNKSGRTETSTPEQPRPLPTPPPPATPKPTPTPKEGGR